MKLTRIIVCASAVLAGHLAGGPASAAIDCIQLDLSRAAPSCPGERASIDASLTSSCSSAERLTLAFEMDGEPAAAKAAVVVPADATRSAQLSVPIPAGLASGTHTLIVKATDVFGDTATMSVDMTIPPCSAD